jgi:hypothetical protein
VVLTQKIINIQQYPPKKFRNQKYSQHNKEGVKKEKREEIPRDPFKKLEDEADERPTVMSVQGPSKTDKEYTIIRFPQEDDYDVDYIKVGIEWIVPEGASITTSTNLLKITYPDSEMILRSSMTGMNF